MSKSLQQNYIYIKNTNLGAAARHQISLLLSTFSWNLVVLQEHRKSKLPYLCSWRQGCVCNAYCPYTFFSWSFPVNEMWKRRLKILKKTSHQEIFDIFTSLNLCLSDFHQPVTMVPAGLKDVCQKELWGPSKHSIQHGASQQSERQPYSSTWHWERLLHLCKHALSPSSSSWKLHELASPPTDNNTDIKRPI